MARGKRKPKRVSKNPRAKARRKPAMKAGTVFVPPTPEVRPHREQEAVDVFTEIFGPCQERNRLINVAELRAVAPELAQDPRTWTVLQFDYVFGILLLEVDGIGHREPRADFGGDEGFRRQVGNDRVKNAYAKHNGFILIRIPNFNKETKRILPSGEFRRRCRLAAARAQALLDAKARGSVSACASGAVPRRA